MLRSSADDLRVINRRRLGQPGQRALPGICNETHFQFQGAAAIRYQRANSQPVCCGTKGFFTYCVSTSSRATLLLVHFEALNSCAVGDQPAASLEETRAPIVRTRRGDNGGWAPDHRWRIFLMNYMLSILRTRGDACVVGYRGTARPSAKARKFGANMFPRIFLPKFLCDFYPRVPRISAVYRTARRGS